MVSLPKMSMTFTATWNIGRPWGAFAAAASEQRPSRSSAPKCQVGTRSKSDFPAGPFLVCPSGGNKGGIKMRHWTMPLMAAAMTMGISVAEAATIAKSNFGTTQDGRRLISTR